MKPTRLLFAAVLMLLLMPNPFAQTPENFAQVKRGFQTFYEQKLKQHGIIGSSFIFIHDNQVVAQNFYGLAHIEQKRAVDENTIYHWASITKTFTGIAIMQLRDRGLLKLNDPIIKYVPELRAVHNPFGAMEEITIRHLLSHSAGFRNPTWPWGGDKDWHPHEPQHWSQLVAMMPYTEIEFKPGSKFSYSNPGIIFLGRVIETLTRDDYEVYIDKNIFKPLGMHRSYFDATPYHLLQYRSHSYYWKEGKLTPGRFDTDTGITVSNGGLNAPLTDMVKYINFLLGDPRQQAVYEQVLKRSTLEEMWQPQIVVQGHIPGQSLEGHIWKEAVGLAFFLGDAHGQHFIGHTGEQNGFLSNLLVRPDNRTACIFAFNTHAAPVIKGGGSPNTVRLSWEVGDWVAEKMFPLFVRK